jgi:tetratricopeptide (TPR) repeat protein
MTDRDTFIKLIETALAANRADYARHTANDWLSSWPGDLEAQALLARAEIQLGAHSTALERLARLIHIDPERTEAYNMLASVLRTMGETTQAVLYEACGRILRGEELDSTRHPQWAIKLRAAYAEMRNTGSKLPVRLAQEALAADPDLALPYVIGMRAQVLVGDRDSAFKLAQVGNHRWPDCVAFLVMLAESCLNHGEIGRGVEYLHRAASLDCVGELSASLLSVQNEYRSLWPAKCEAELSRPVPADVASLLGDNRLVGSKESPAAGAAVDSASEDNSAASAGPSAPSRRVQSSPLPQPEPWEAFRGPDPGEAVPSEPPAPEKPEALIEIDEDLRRIANRLNARRRVHDEDGRVPAYIVITSRSRMLQKLGDEQFAAIDQKIMKLVEAVRRRPGWTAYRIYPDDPSTLDPFALAPCDPGNAWQIKLRLADLDAALARRGEMIGAVYIIGGNEIIPFHRLPNPTDDSDDEVPSDNPYSSGDENYFLPEWPVGRLPLEGDEALVSKLLDASIAYHQQIGRPVGNLHRISGWLRRRLSTFFNPNARTLGYTASIWKKASLAVYKSIGDPKSMFSSPPVEASRLPAGAVRPIHLSYFNLHGLEDSPEWYGQRDPLRDQDVKIEFPIALRPQDVVNSGRAPRVVFSEACYGAHVIGKQVDTALSLKFLSSGTRAIVGSTKISYGSITPPLIAADLLGRLFWQNLNARMPVGEALRRAKLQLASEMHKRQGYLDGEDQKTLISFVLYGDPLFRPGVESVQLGEKTIIRRSHRPSTMKTACALGGPEVDQGELSATTMKKIELIVAQYLPGMQDAACSIHQQHMHCEGKDHACPTHLLGQKHIGEDEGSALIVTLSKSIPDGERIHPHFARLTLDSTGKVMKLAVSR